MTTLTAFLHPPVERIRRWLHDGSEHPSDHPKAGPPQGLGGVPIQQQHHQAWLGTGGRVDRLRRNERHGDEKKD